MNICFNIPHAFHPNSSKLDNARTLRRLLDCMVGINMDFLKEHRVPSLYNSGVVYGRTHIWEPIPALYLSNKTPINPVFWKPEGLSGGEQRGDCKSLATARIAELKLKGIECEPVFRWAPREDDPRVLDFHILLMNKDGSFEDPSRKLGMGTIEVARFM